MLGANIHMQPYAAALGSGFLPSVEMTDEGSMPG
jgi:hypothetical protein